MSGVRSPKLSTKDMSTSLLTSLSHPNGPNSSALSTSAASDSSASPSAEGRRSASTPFLQVLALFSSAFNENQQQKLIKEMLTLLEQQDETGLLYALKRFTRGLAASTSSSRKKFSSALKGFLEHFFSHSASLKRPLSIEDVVKSIEKECCGPNEPTRAEQSSFRCGFALAVIILFQTGLLQEIATQEERRVVGWVERLVLYGSVDRHAVDVCFEAAACATKVLTFQCFQQNIESLFVTNFSQNKNEVKGEKTAHKAAAVVASAEKSAESGETDGSKRRRKSKQKDHDGNNHDADANASAQNSVSPHVGNASLVDLSTLSAEHLTLLYAWRYQYETNMKKASSAGRGVLSYATRHLFADAHLAALLSVLTSPARFSDREERNEPHVSELSSPWKETWDLCVNWQQLWNLCGTFLLGQKSNDQRRCCGLQCFSYLLRRVEKNGDLSTLFIAPFLRCFMTQLSSAANHLHSYAKQVKSDILAKAEMKPAFAATIMAALLDPECGSPRFDVLTRTNTIHTLLGMLDEESVSAYFADLVRSFHLTYAADTSKLVSDQNWIINQMYVLCKRPSMAAKTSHIIDDVLLFFLFYGHFDTSTQPAGEIKAAVVSSKKKPRRSIQADPFIEHAICKLLPSELSPLIRSSCQQRMWSLLDEYLPRSKSKSHDNRENNDVEKTDATASLSETMLLSRAEKVALAYESLLKVFSPLVVGDEECQKTRASTVLLLKQLQSKQVSVTIQANHEMQAVKLLLVHLLLLSLSEPDAAISLLEELIVGFNDYRTATLKKEKKRKRPAADKQMDHPIFVELLLDILLSLLVRPSALFRDLSKLVLMPFMSKMTETAVNDLLRVLSRRASDQMHKRSKFKHGKKEDELDDDFEPFDVEVVSNDSGREEGQNMNESFPSAVKSSHDLPATAFNAIGEGESEDEEVDLEGLHDLLAAPLSAEEHEKVIQASTSQYDSALSTMVRLRQENSKKQRENLVAQTLHFQSRVLDLVETFARVHPQSKLLLDPILLGLLDVAHSTRVGDKVKPLHQKVVGVLKGIFRGKKAHASIHFSANKTDECLSGTKTADLSSISVDEAQTIMSTLLERALKTTESESLLLYSHALLFMSKVSLPAAALFKADYRHAEMEAINLHRNFVVALYSKAARLHWTHRHKLNVRFFLDLLAKAPAIAFTLVDYLSMSLRSSLSLSSSTASEHYVRTDGEGKKDQRENNVSVITPAVSHICSVHLQTEAFTYLSAIFSQKAALENLSDAHKIRTIQLVVDAIESALVFDSLVANGQTMVVSNSVLASDASVRLDADFDPSKLSKKEYKVWKEKEKKKKRLEKCKAQKRALRAQFTAESSETTTDVKGEMMRLKAALLAANQIPSHIKRLSDSGGVSVHSLQKALTSIPVTNLLNARSAVHNVCTSFCWPLPEAMVQAQAEAVSNKQARRNAMKESALAQTAVKQTEKGERSKLSLKRKREKDVVSLVPRKNKLENTAMDFDQVATAKGIRKSHKQGNHTKGLSKEQRAAVHQVRSQSRGDHAQFDKGLEKLSEISLTKELKNRAAVQPSKCNFTSSDVNKKAKLTRS